MDTFWIVVACIILVPLLYFAAPYIAVFLTMIPIQIIGFFCKIIDFFKDKPTPQNSTHNPPEKQEHKESQEEQLHKPISSQPSSPPPQSSTSKTSPVPSTKNPQSPQPETFVVDIEKIHKDAEKAAKERTPNQPASQPSKIERITMKSQLDEKTAQIHQKEAEQINKKSDALISILGICCLVLVIAIVLLAAFLPNNSTNEPVTEAPHAHEYSLGQCIYCDSFDFSYCFPLYEDMLSIMDSMENPYSDLSDIETILDKLPDDYRNVRRFKAQCAFFKYRFELFTSECRKNNPDYLKIQNALFEILDKETKDSYRDWNIENTVFHLLNYPDNGILTWSILQGVWKDSNGYYFHTKHSSTEAFLDTNLPRWVSLSHDFYYTAHGYIIQSTDESAGNCVRDEFRIDEISSNCLTLYSYSAKKTFTLYKSTSDSSSSSGSSSSSNSSGYNPSYSSSYIGNTQTKVFHRSSCSYLPDTINRIKFVSRQQAVIKGYTPCSHCDP